jgi:hypothetical protein
MFTSLNMHRPGFDRTSRLRGLRTCDGPPEHLSAIRRANRWRRACIDVIAVGSDGVGRRWRDALQRIADESGGTCLKR